MAFSFATESWSAEIAEESELPQYQTAEIRLVDTKKVTQVYNETTGKYVTLTDGIEYEGQARVIPVRWGVFSGGESQANATTLSAIRVQIPSTSGNIRVRKGWKVFVTQADRSPFLVGRIFAVTSDIQGSESASRTFQCEADGDAVSA